MRCQFEEKQFEQHLNNELLQKQELLYVPGQVLEGHLGFDAAIYSTNRGFWRLFHELPYYFYERFLYHSRTGITIDPKWWDELDRALPHFPRFRFNVFIQHKRPEYLTTSKSNEWKDWNSSYFRRNCPSRKPVSWAFAVSGNHGSAADEFAAVFALRATRNPVAEHMALGHQLIRVVTRHPSPVESQLPPRTICPPLSRA